MKKYFLLSVIIIGILFSCSNTNTKIKDPENIGKKVFKLLKEINKTTKVDYLNEFIKPLEILEIYEGEDIDSIRKIVKQDPEINFLSWEKELENKIENIKRKRNKQIKDDFNELKDDAGELGIVWDKIEYLDYTYEIITEGFICIEKKYMVIMHLKDV